MDTRFSVCDIWNIPSVSGYGQCLLFASYPGVVFMIYIYIYTQYADSILVMHSSRMQKSASFLRIINAVQSMSSELFNQLQYPLAAR